MENFESVYKELENLFINKLPEYIEKINKEHNDGIILKPFENKSMEENCIKTPSFSFKLEETENEEKDRIIENTIYTISLEIKLPPNTENKSIILYRYFETINMSIIEYEGCQEIKILSIRGYKVFIRITI